MSGEDLKFTKTHSRVTFIDRALAVEKESNGSASGIFHTEGKNSFLRIKISLSHTNGSDTCFVIDEGSRDIQIRSYAAVRLDQNQQ